MPDYITDDKDISSYKENSHYSDEEKSNAENPNEERHFE